MKKRSRKSQKGGPYEREVCYLLTAWWTGDPDRDVVFWRTAGSGGRATVRGRRGKRTNTAHCGDLAALDADAGVLTGLVTFEIKRGHGATSRRCNLLDVVDKPRRLAQEGMEGWIEQAERSAANAGTPYWAVIHRRDGREPYLLIPMELYEALGQVSFPGPLMMFWGRVRRADGTRKRVSLVTVLLDAFLAAVTPARVRAVAAAHHTGANGHGGAKDRR